MVHIGAPCRPGKTLREKHRVQVMGIACHGFVWEAGDRDEQDGAVAEVVNAVGSDISVSVSVQDGGGLTEHGWDSRIT